MNRQSRREMSQRTMKWNQWQWYSDLLVTVMFIFQCVCLVTNKAQDVNWGRIWWTTGGFECGWPPPKLVGGTATSSRKLELQNGSGSGRKKIHENQPLTSAFHTLTRTQVRAWRWQQTCEELDGFVHSLVGIVDVFLQWLCVDGRDWIVHPTLVPRDPIGRRDP